MRLRKRLLSLVMCICLVFTVYVPQSAEKVEAANTIQTFTGNLNEVRIFSYLTETMGLNSAAACGIMANIYRECRFNEKAAATSGNSYGICQWYKANKTRLLDYCEDNDLDYTTLTAQLYFLNYDLNSRFKTLVAKLKAVSDTDEGAYQAAYDFCYNYERPQNYVSASESRGKLAQEIFWSLYGGQRLIVALEAAEHTHSYTTETTPATLSADGSIKSVCSVCDDVKSTQTIKKIASVTLSATSFVYNGKVRKPTVKVKDSAGKTIAASNYTVSYSSGCKNVGIYTVTVTFKGKYSGKKTQTYQIIPKSSTLKSVSGKKKGLSIKWSKNTTQTTGYQLQVTTQSSFKSGVTTLTVSNKTVSKTVSKLTAKKKYYVRVRTYKSVKYKGENVNIYSAWSSTKNAKTKA